MNENTDKKQKSRRGFFKFMFGGNREKAIQRDGEKCVQCGMTRKEHKEKWGRDITVDHINGSGCNSKVKNSSLDNLQTLCLSCHGRKDNVRRKEYSRNRGINSPDNIRDIKRLYKTGKYLQKDIAKMYECTERWISRITTHY